MIQKKRVDVPDDHLMNVSRPCVQERNSVDKLPSLAIGTLLDKSHEIFEGHGSGEFGRARHRVPPDDRDLRRAGPGPQWREAHEPPPFVSPHGLPYDRPSLPRH